MWNVVAGMTLESWSHLIRRFGGSMNADKVAEL
jgi:hypothetical protein